jgi:hypothetical protein
MVNENADVFLTAWAESQRNHELKSLFKSAAKLAAP